MGNKLFSNLVCPVCGKTGDYMKDDNEEVYCIHCGLIIQSPYPYTAGIRFDTLTEILQKNEEKKLQEKRWRKEYDRIKKFQKV
ncbi:MAG: hypothetical protein IJF83_03585 [Methanobrevibacter sp.]|nr:hypothetical protein [Methanobrevibacter sp.]